MIVINLFGAPGSGKSTTAAGLFFLMKINKMSVELVTEFAKELVLERRENVFGDQNYIFAEQARRTRRCRDSGYQFVVTDSPLLLPAYYSQDSMPASFEPMVMDEFHGYSNLNYFLHRRHSFEAIGRRHTEAQAAGIVDEMKRFLVDRDVEITDVDAGPTTPETLLKDILSKMPKTVGMPFSLPES